MKLARNLYVIATGIVAGSLFLAGLAQWLDSGFGEGWRSAALVCYVVGAVGVIWLGWYWLKLAGTITSIAREIADSNSVERIGKEKLNAKRYPLYAINELSKALGERFDSYANHIARLEEQIKDLQIQTQLSQRQKKNTEAIIYSIRDAVIVVDEYGRLLMANEGAERLFNFDFSNSRHKAIGELIGTTNSEFVDFLRQSRQNKARATRREIAFSKDGEQKTYDCVVSCVPAGVYPALRCGAGMTGPAPAEARVNSSPRKRGAGVSGVVAVLHDITREKQIRQMKNDFVSHVSHELKTPLASITAYSEMLAEGEARDSQARKEFCSVIQSQAQRLNRLIEDILNTSRIESGLIKVEKAPVSLTILIEEQLQMIKGYAGEKNIEIIRQKPIVFDQVYADKDMISQVIINLLSNAVKYTRPGGSVKIETEVDELAGVGRVSITDTGVGIPEDEIGHVFDKFYRVDASKKQATGTGLGLNLVKQIVEKVHNGRAFVRSKPGVGSTFGFELPLAKAAEAV